MIKFHGKNESKLWKSAGSSCAKDFQNLGFVFKAQYKLGSLFPRRSKAYQLKLKFGHLRADCRI